MYVVEQQRGAVVFYLISFTSQLGHIYTVILIHFLLWFSYLVYSIAVYRNYHVDYKIYQISDIQTNLQKLSNTHRSQIHQNINPDALSSQHQNSSLKAKRFCLLTIQLVIQIEGSASFHEQDAGVVIQTETIILMNTQNVCLLPFFQHDAFNSSLC